MRRYLIVLLIGIPVIAILFVGAGYVYDEVVASDRVSRGVSVAGTDVSRYTEEDTAAVVQAYENRLTSQTVQLVVDGTTVTLDPLAIGLTIDHEAVAAEAMEARRQSSIGANFNAWWRTFSSTSTVDIPVSIDEDKIAAILEDLSLTAIDKPAYDGAIKVGSGDVIAEYPQPGLRIDAESAIPLIRDQLVRIDRVPVVVPLISITPRISDTDVDEALALAQQLVESPVTLRIPGQPGTIVFTPAGLTTALRSEVVVHSPAVLEVTLDAETLEDIAARSADRFTIPPTDATFGFDEETRVLSVVPSERGQVVDLAGIPDVVVNAALESGSGVLPMTDGEEAAFTTAMAEAMGPLGEVSTFTTLYPCCQSRVTNIQLLADTIGGNLVMPGETFSINDTAGERKEEDGYVRAGAIINGRIQCCESRINIGGGTSQFATTFYNAVFFGCYEDVFHRPHSLYFPRYPFIREATIGFPSPDVKFRNDSETVVYIDTTYTPTSVTVTLFGNNGGRVCTSERSGNTITRVMTWPDESVTTQEWTWNYRQPKPDPDTTTTVHIDDTTTTTDGSTTTTTVASTTTTVAPTTTTVASTTTTTPATTTAPP